MVDPHYESNLNFVKADGSNNKSVVYVSSNELTSSFHWMNKSQLGGIVETVEVVVVYYTQNPFTDYLLQSIQTGSTNSVVGQMTSTSIPTAAAGWSPPSGESLSFTISKTWNGGVPDDQSEIHIRIWLQGEEDAQVLMIQVDAPFYNDPQPQPTLSPPGSTPGLWDYEVVELFFLGDDDKYLEIELAPKGHYLLLQLHGVRNIIRESLHLDHYITELRGNRWFGEAAIPLHYFPPNVRATNMYAIHKSDPKRVYMALYPAVDDNNDGKCPHTAPDFHRLQYFKPLNLPGLCKNKLMLLDNNFSQ